MLKDVDFTSIVCKLAFLLFLIDGGETTYFGTTGFFKVAIGWICLAFLILLLLVCCFLAVREKEETMETRNATRFAFRVFGLFRIVKILIFVPSLLRLLATQTSVSMPLAIFTWQGVFLLVGLSLLFLPDLWNRLILAVGRLLRRY